MDITFAIKGIGNWLLTTILGGEWEEILSALLHLIDVLSQHVKIDRRSVSLSLIKDRNQHHLVADIPLIPQRSRRRKVN